MHPKERTFAAKVTSGRGIARAHIAQSSAEIESLTAGRPVSGTLNLLLRRPLLLSHGSALAFDHGRRFLWPARLNDYPIWLYRWQNAPVHVVECVSPVILREQLGLSDGDAVGISVRMADLEPMSVSAWLVWAALWWGRREWAYECEHDPHTRRATRWGARWGAVQSAQE